MHDLAALKREICSIVDASPVPEDPLHARNTPEWLLKLKPGADDALQIAALGHDIERALPARRIRREQYRSYDAFKSAHARNSARILQEVMYRRSLPPRFTADVCRLVRRHETGGDFRSDLLREADAISFFDVNLPMYLAREGAQKTLERCRWGYERLSASGRREAAGFLSRYPQLEVLLRKVFDNTLAGHQNPSQK